MQAVELVDEPTKVFIAVYLLIGRQGLINLQGYVSCLFQTIVSRQFPLTSLVFYMSSPWH